MDNTLKNLLQQKNIGKDYRQHFSLVARELMNNYVIKKGGIKYRIFEIEFYLFSDNHKDIITYPRVKKAGLWYFHNSGVDITFESNEKHYGGILIRGIERKSDNQYICGPLKCVDELWNDFDAFGDGSDCPVLVYEQPDCIDKDLWKGKRWIDIREDFRIKKVNDWIKRAKINDFNDAGVYITEVLDKNKLYHVDSPYQYRYVFLSERQFDEIPKSYKARPQIKKGESEECSFTEMSKVDSAG